MYWITNSFAKSAPIPAPKMWQIVFSNNTIDVIKMPFLSWDFKGLQRSKKYKENLKSYYNG